MKRRLGRIVAAFFVLVLATSAATHTQAQTCVQPPPNLVSWWPGDGNPNDVADGNPGTLIGPVTYTPGKVGQAFNLPGSFVGDTVGARVEAADAANLQITGPITLDAWVSFHGVSPQTPPGPGLIANSPVVAKWGNSNVGGTGGYGLFVDANGTPAIGVSPGFGGTVLFAPTPLQPNVFTHLAGVWDGSQIRLFVNGQQVASAPFVGPLDGNNGVPLLIGGYNPAFTGLSDSLIGAIDEVDIFNRALSNLEIQAIVNAGSAGKCKTPQQQGNFVYTNDDITGPNTVSGFAVASNGTLAPLPGSPFSTGGIGAAVCCLNRPIISTNGNFLFASNTGSNDVSVFSIDAATGALSLVAGSPFGTGGSGDVFGIALSPTPDGMFLIAANSGSNNLTVFSIASSGALTPIAGSPFPPLSTPWGIKVSPDGKFLAVAERSSNQVEMFSIASNGSLTSLGGFPGKAFDSFVDIDCATRLLYGSSGGVGVSTIVDAYSIASNGTLTPVPGSPFIEGTLPPNRSDNNVVLLSPDGKTLFVTNQFENTITVFSVTSDGSLSLVAGSPFANPGFIPSGMATSKDGTFLYVANGHNSINSVFSSISVFSVASNGAIAPVASPFLTGTGQSGFLRSLTAFPPKSCILTPTITGISPTSATAGEAAFTLTVNGTNFVSGSTVNFNGNARTTTSVSATQLTAVVPASDIATAGTFNVTVTNSVGVTSNAVSFTVNNPVPTIISLSPSSTLVSGAAFTLTVNGTGFVSTSVVNIGGNVRATTFVSATQLTAAILASDIATAGTFGVTVTNAAPGGGTSSTVSFTVLTPQQATQAIINSVNALFSQGVINGGQDNSLVVQLQHAIGMMSAGKNNGAIGNLGSFISEVNDLFGSGVLDPVQAAVLVSEAESVIAAL